MNIERTNHIVFSSKHLNKLTFIRIVNMHSQRVSSKKFLGVPISQNLTLNEHIEIVFKKIFKCTSVLNKVENLLNRISLYM